MYFQCHLDTTLPTLAWCAEITRGADAVEVVHGASVEAGPEAFVEGAWSGDFDGMGFPEATTFTGTGGRRRAGTMSRLRHPPTRFTPST
jgi:hypothetical protein